MHVFLLQFVWYASYLGFVYGNVLIRAGVVCAARNLVGQEIQICLVNTEL